MQRTCLTVALALAMGTAGAALPLDEQVPGAVVSMTADAAPWTFDADAGITEAELLPAEMLPGVTWTNALGVDFRSNGNLLSYATHPTTGSFFCQEPATNLWAYARLDIPHGRKMTYFRMWGQDSSATDDIRAVLRESCLPDLGPASAPVNTNLADIKSETDAGSFTVTTAVAGSPVANAHLCTYWAYVEFTSCSTSTVRKIRVQHQR
ncbi:hypothetical protein [Dokdonella sp.]|uniref:hypothetical protein n=1 Tax=Dokdonella sp. TaxID=2291710 RepID=UPI0031C9D931|nr:hypothetical protein [Dokdonella sp.]